MISTASTNEKAVAGITTGLIGLNETVTWRAFHLFKTRSFTSVISAFEFPYMFKDEMTSGDLKSFSHIHSFESQKGGTLMTDKVSLEAPFGFAGKILMAVFLKNYFRKLLCKRNAVIKKFAENGQAAEILKNNLS